MHLLTSSQRGVPKLTSDFMFLRTFGGHWNPFQGTQKNSVNLSSKALNIVANQLNWIDLHANVNKAGNLVLYHLRFSHIPN